MIQFINTTANVVANKKQTVLIETITKGEKKTLNFYCGNWPKRAAAFYDGYVAGQFKPVRKGEETKHYRLLKLFKAEQEAEAMGIEPNYMVTENYSDQAPERTQEEEEAGEGDVKCSVDLEGAKLMSEGPVEIDGEMVHIQVFDASDCQVTVEPVKKGSKKKGGKK